MSEIHGGNSEISLVECTVSEGDAERVKIKESRKKMSQIHTVFYTHTYVGSIAINIKENSL